MTIREVAERFNALAWKADGALQQVSPVGSNPIFSFPQIVKRNIFQNTALRAKLP